MEDDGIEHLEGVLAIHFKVMMVTDEKLKWSVDTFLKEIISLTTS